MQGIITNHIHLIIKSGREQKPELIPGNFNRISSKAIVKLITDRPKESRKEWLPDQFLKTCGNSSNADLGYHAMQ